MLIGLPFAANYSKNSWNWFGTAIAREPQDLHLAQRWLKARQIWMRRD